MAGGQEAIVVGVCPSESEQRYLHRTATSSTEVLVRACSEPPARQFTSEAKTSQLAIIFYS
jgi:hypothetical protein